MQEGNTHGISVTIYFVAIGLRSDFQKLSRHPHGANVMMINRI